MRNLGKHFHPIGLVPRFMAARRNRLGALALIAMGWSGAAQAQANPQEYPCIASAFAPDKEGYRLKAQENIAKYVPALTASIREKYTDAYVLGYKDKYDGYGGQDLLGSRTGVWLEPWLHIERTFKGNKKYKISDLQMDALWPAYHADFLAALANELGALDYRTITPTCAQRYAQGALTSTHTTMFQLENGSVGILTYVVDEAPRYDSVKAWKRNIEKRLKRGTTPGGRLGGGTSLAHVYFAVLPTLPILTRNPKNVKDDAIARASHNLAPIYGLSDEDMQTVYRRMIDWEIKKQADHEWCVRHHPEHYENSDRTSLFAWCMGRPKLADFFARQTVPLTEPERSDVLSEFQQVTADYRAVHGSAAIQREQLDYAKAMASRANSARWDAAEKRRERADTWAAIAAGVSDGAASVSRSNERDIYRAAAAASSRFRAQYGCTAGSCGRSHPVPRRRPAAGGAGATSAPNSAAASTAAVPAGRPMPPTSQPKERPLRPASGTGNGVSYLQNGAFKPDSEICAQARVAAQSGIPRKNFAFSGQCTCRDAGGEGYVVKRRECEIPYTYLEAVPDDKEPQSMTR